MTTKMEFIELIRASRVGTKGRILLIGKKDQLVYKAIEDDIEFKQRLGIFGVNKNESPNYLGLPLVYKNKLKYYLLGKYLIANRAAPFYGWLIRAEQLAQFGYKLTHFIHALDDFLAESELDLNTYEPTKINCLVKKAPIPKKVKNNELLKDYLEQGYPIRFYENKVAIQFIKGLFLETNKEQLTQYTWSTAPFHFPSAPDGAKLHIAVEPLIPQASSV